MVSIVRDIAERKRLNAQIVYMAHHDVLTGLANRSMFMTSLDRAIVRSVRADKRFAVLYLDLDQFKDVNDTRGHLIGDRLLRLVAERLQAGIRVNELVAASAEMSSRSCLAISMSLKRSLSWQIGSSLLSACLF